MSQKWHLLGYMWIKTRIYQNDSSSSGVKRGKERMKLFVSLLKSVSEDFDESWVRGANVQADGLHGGLYLYFRDYANNVIIIDGVSEYPYRAKDAFMNFEAIALEIIDSEVRKYIKQLQPVAYQDFVKAKWQIIFQDEKSGAYKIQEVKIVASCDLGNRIVDLCVANRNCEPREIRLEKSSLQNAS